MKSYLVIQDFASRDIIGIDKRGEPYTTKDLLKAKHFANRKEATDFRDKYPMENWILVFAKIKFTKKQLWYHEKNRPKWGKADNL